MKTTAAHRESLAELFVGLMRAEKKCSRAQSRLRNGTKKRKTKEKKKKETT